MSLSVRWDGVSASSPKRGWLPRREKLSPTVLPPNMHISSTELFCWFLRGALWTSLFFDNIESNNNNHDWLIHAYEKLEPTNYITEFIQHNVRPDGRTFCASRSEYTTFYIGT
jgi:hypothetical protein